MNGWNGEGHMDGWHMGADWMPVWWVLGVALIGVLVWGVLRARRGR